MTASTHRISDFMTTQAHTIRPGESVASAQAHMDELKIRHLPVLHGGRLVGILSDRDIKNAMAWRDGQDSATKDELTVEDVYTQETYVAGPDTGLQEVAEKMAEKRYGCAVVTDPNDKVIGIFTTTDACAALAKVLGQG